MATNTAGSSGPRMQATNGPSWIRYKVQYSDWTGTNNDRRTVGVLPPKSMVIGSLSHVCVRAGFTDTTGDDLDIGISGGDDDWFGSGLDVNTNGTLLTLDDLTDTERYSASERTVTVNFTTAPTGDGTAGEAWIHIGYFVLE